MLRYSAVFRFKGERHLQIILSLWTALDTSQNIKRVFPQKALFVWFVVSQIFSTPTTSLLDVNFDEFSWLSCNSYTLLQLTSSLTCFKRMDWSQKRNMSFIHMYPCNGFQSNMIYTKLLFILERYKYCMFVYHKIHTAYGFNSFATQINVFLFLPSYYN